MTPAGPLARVVVGALIHLVRALSARWRHRLAQLVAGLAWHLRVRRRVTLENLRLALPERSAGERERLARGAYGTMALAAVEAVTSDLLTDEEVAAAVQVDDWKGLDALVAAGAPALLVSAHLGSWELFAEVMARRGLRLSAVVRPLRGAFNAWIVKNRTAAGVELLSPRGALRAMQDALGRGRIVVQLIDQALPARGALWVPFFGRLASTTPAVSVVALRTGVPVYVAVAVREGARLRMLIEGPVPVSVALPRDEAIRAHATELTAILERAIRQYPEQWLWLHRRWKGTPPAAERPNA